MRRAIKHSGALVVRCWTVLLPHWQCMPWPSQCRLLLVDLSWCPTREERRNDGLRYSQAVTKWASPFCWTISIHVPIDNRSPCASDICDIFLSVLSNELSLLPIVSGCTVLTCPSLCSVAEKLATSRSSGLQLLIGHPFIRGPLSEMSKHAERKRRGGFRFQSEVGR
jgi:hypothetical protein